MTSRDLAADAHSKSLRRFPWDEVDPMVPGDAERGRSIRPPRLQERRRRLPPELRQGRRRPRDRRKQAGLFQLLNEQRRQRLMSRRLEREGHLPARLDATRQNK